MSAHTPGPWQMDTAMRGAAFLVMEPVTSTVVARCEFDPSDREALLAAEADARLIAAAPDLLRALELQLVDITDDSGPHDRACPKHKSLDRACSLRCTIARNAIAKARGTTP